MKKIMKSLSILLAILIFTSSVFATQNNGNVERREERINGNNQNTNQSKTEMVNKNKTTTSTSTKIFFLFKYLNI